MASIPEDESAESDITDSETIQMIQKFQKSRRRDSLCSFSSENLSDEECEEKGRNKLPDYMTLGDVEVEAPKSQLYRLRDENSNNSDPRNPFSNL